MYALLVFSLYAIENSDPMTCATIHVQCTSRFVNCIIDLQFMNFKNHHSLFFFDISWNILATIFKRWKIYWIFHPLSLCVTLHKIALCRNKILLGVFLTIWINESLGMTDWNKWWIFLWYLKYFLIIPAEFT